MNDGKMKYMVIGRGVPLENKQQGLEWGGGLYFEKVETFKYPDSVITDCNKGW